MLVVEGGGVLVDADVDVGAGVGAGCMIFHMRSLRRGPVRPYVSMSVLRKGPM
jgi:hypothetical protein